MAYQTKQEANVKIGVYLYNGGYRPFTGYPISLECWNLSARPDLEFMGGKDVAQALDGFEYGNGEGYRLIVSATVDNLYSLSEKTSWRSIFELLAGSYDKTFGTVVTSGTGSSITSLVLSGAASATNDYYNGLEISAGLSAGNGVIITDYDGATKTATLSGNASWSNGVTLTLTAQPNLQRFIGLSLTGEDADILYYNVSGNLFGMVREFTINKQLINIGLRSVTRYSTIPDSFIISG
jgi:hypothetical protein